MREQPSARSIRLGVSSFVRVVPELWRPATRELAVASSVQPSGLGAGDLNPVRAVGSVGEDPGDLGQRAEQSHSGLAEHWTGLLGLPLEQ